MESYSQRRVEQERLAAEAAADLRARRCHEQLARLHSVRVVKPATSDDAQAAQAGFIILSTRLN